MTNQTAFRKLPLNRVETKNQVTELTMVCYLQKGSKKGIIILSPSVCTSLRSDLFVGILCSCERK